MTEKKQTASLAGQILSIAAVLFVFVLMWGTFWWLVTSRCVPDADTEMKVKMIDVSDNLPFDENSHIAHCQTETKLSGDLPVLDGAAALFPLYSAFAEALYPADSVAYNTEKEDFEADSALQFRNTVRGFNALVEGTADVFFSAYPSQAQMDYAAEAGVELVTVPIGREAFVFLANIHNPVDSLTQEQLRGMFTGKYTNWNQVGGVNRPIHPIKRIAGSGSQSALERFLGGKEVYTNPLNFMGASIGYSFRWYTTEVVREGNVKMLAVDGVYPNETTIRDGSYPLTSNFYAMYRADNDNPNIPLLIDFIRSEEGQALIEASGYSGIPK